MPFFMIHRFLLELRQVAALLGKPSYSECDQVSPCCDFGVCTTIPFALFSIGRRLSPDMPSSSKNYAIPWGEYLFHAATQCRQ